MTSQTNLVRPGSSGQTGHRDYHLGFQTPEEASFYPVTAHQTSPFLTLQGAIAHCDMPVESGPTRYLPFSQMYGPGYIACNMPEFKSYFEENYIQLPLKKGDAVFFNPAVMHGAGENKSNKSESLPRRTLLPPLPPARKAILSPPISTSTHPLEALCLNPKRTSCWRPSSAG